VSASDAFCGGRYRRAALFRRNGTSDSGGGFQASPFPSTAE